jgi:hypothetical protein
MRVHTAMGIGIALGALIGAVALGSIKVEQQTQLNAQSWAWWIVVITTILPLASYLEDELLLKGPWGGFVSGLGTGLGFFLLLAGRIM